jgi:hypothetical protein
MPLKWTPDNVKRDVLETLVGNAELVGRFVESDARRRLLAVSDPDWGEGHRNYVARLITNEVEQGRNEVVVRVGLPPGRTTAEGRPTRHLGYYIETGSRTAAAHPFLRPAVFQNGPEIVALLSDA